jgi:hypothetical protein
MMMMIIIIICVTANGCRPVAVVIMHAHRYEIRIHNIRFHENTFSDCRVVRSGQTDDCWARKPQQAHFSNFRYKRAVEFIWGGQSASSGK